ncbi:MAG: hypothetical protein ACXACG_17630 [Candidatus Thorarchaeota archaeon]|jgi:thiamine pyrophosphate-dependent acetolactate synthase large subunit-like protein
MAKFRCSVCNWVYTIDAALREAFDSGKPSIIEVIVDPDKMAA